ncbi:MAG: uroporphyrinogen-III C-methyltransferase [Aestuariivita sp.]|nr:uroporphyrinogen-III C-methyltransferase [Aestuariivita sp.]MCY4202669.1 uroporphyrinogen-III C-methyltransferase [Aestuariivita sp.]MCY4287311.1 uroporphyrinogen-III C-methyltransferase [Aestuariivita sp.]MCY4346544.1 uroporphyrinogen-III C-methyltransferase [Aestuariivita sp.]
MAGFVSFVGSGPGDPELLSIRAVDRLKRADAVLFDDLSSGPILDHVGEDADLIGVGKRAGRASPKQHHVSQLLVDHAKVYQRIVRLKSGDGGLFGRLEEELTALQEAGIDYEIVPGISSACAAAAAAGIPLTRRLSARRVQFITGHGIDGKLPKDLNLPALADPTASTVIFMGKRTFSQLVRLLVENGLPPETSALLAEDVSGPNQHIQRGTIKQIAEEFEKKMTDLPAVILYGSLAEF